MKRRSITSHNKSRSQKRGMYFTLDAVFGSIIIISAVVLWLTFSESRQDSSALQHTAVDTIRLLDTLTVSDMNVSLTDDVLATNLVNESDTVLRAIGVLWATNNSLAPLYAQEVLQTFLPQYSYAVYAETDLMTSSTFIPQSQATRIATAKQQISGIAFNKPVTGTTATAYLQKVENKSTSSFTFFGGFVGQGNITVLLSLPADVDSSRVNELIMELDTPEQFSLLVNDVECGVYVPSTGNMTADGWNLNACTPLLVPGDNAFELRYDDIDEAYVAGGFIKASYHTDTFATPSNLNTTLYRFPEVEGVVNLFDSFIVPQTLRNLTIYLHYETTDPTPVVYLTIGEKTVWSSNKTGTVSVTLTDVNLTPPGGLLDYTFLSNKTVPIRFSAFNNTQTVLTGGNADIVVVTDYSGSMKKDIDSWNQGTAGPVTDCDSVYTNNDIRRTHLARCLDKEVVNITLNYTGNRLWPVHYVSNELYWYNNPMSASALTGYYETFSPQFPQQGKDKTCLACALSEAYQIFSTYNETNRSRYVLLMSDGLPTHCTGAGCAGTSTSYGAEICEGFCDTNGQSGCGGGMNSCTDSSCKNAIDNSLVVAQKLVDEFNVTFFTVAFGPVESCSNATTVLQNIAALNNGTYYHSSDPQALRLIYQNISISILQSINLQSQVAVVPTGTAASTLYGDSYILARHDTPAVVRLNEIELTRQTPQFSSCSPVVSFPSQVRIKEAQLVSYSGHHWTDVAMVNGQAAFNLSEFLVPYYLLGDPYRIFVEPTWFNVTNTFFINTGDDVLNSSGCSLNNSLVYTMLIPSATPRTAVYPTAIGCTWTIEHDVGTSQTIVIPKGYAGSNTCSYTSASIAYNNQDAYDVAVFALLESLDYDGDGRIFVSLSEEDIEIIVSKVSDVPYLWGPSIFEVRVWQ